jgi:hypothetical protein
LGILGKTRLSPALGSSRYTDLARIMPVVLFCNFNRLGFVGG